MEYGIPGHASKKGWANRLQQWLKQRGVRFEAEGEATRISLDSGLLVEIAESLEGDGYDIVMSIPLPGTGEEASSEEALAPVRDAFELAGMLGGELRYELDTSMPGYPVLRVMRGYRDPEEMVDALIAALDRLLSR